ncbi:uncharacterized protein [Manis javanica]|uniref:uncharacterized protein isoform X1 n=1 Tax=Manis javanica TaxID=9974 RepID=UPI003C6DA766
MAGSCGPLWVRPGVPLQESVSCYVRYGLKPIGDLELVFCSNLAQSRFAHGRTGNGGPGWKHATPSPGHRFPRAQSCGGKPHAGYWISWVPQEKGSAPKLSTCWPCFSLLLSPPLRKSSRTYKKLKKRDEDANREWLLKEARAIVNQQLCTLTGCQYTRKQGMVPFLGLFLHDVPVDQLPDNNDGDGMRQRQLSAQSRKVRDGVKTPWAGPCLAHPLGLTCLERVKTHRAEDTKCFVRWGVASRPPSWRRSWRPNSGNRQGWMALEGRWVPV